MENILVANNLIKTFERHEKKQKKISFNAVDDISLNVGANNKLCFIYFLSPLELIYLKNLIISEKVTTTINPINNIIVTVIKIVSTLGLGFLPVTAS